MVQMHLHTHEEMLDIVLGKQGTVLRDEYEFNIKSLLMRKSTKKPYSLRIQRKE